MTDNCDHQIVITGLDGSNPLAFLAAVGTLRTLADSRIDLDVRMGWQQHQGVWRPYVLSSPQLSTDGLVEILANRLKVGFTVADEVEKTRARTASKCDSARKALKDKLDEIKRRRLNRAERRQAEEKELEPVRQNLSEARRNWLAALSDAVSSPELALGKDLSVLRSEYRDVAERIIEVTSQHDRVAADLMASFGCDGCFDSKTQRVKTTPFCFISGSGQQYFLDTVRQLVSAVDVPQIKKMLFEAWIHQDEKLSMRWDPIEDRRYAMMWNDPTSSGNEAKTNWAANLLAYRGLSALPSAPGARGLETAAFSDNGGSRAFNWPMWSGPLSFDTVRSLLALPQIVADPPEYRCLSAIGIKEVFRAQRIQVGNPPLCKINFAPAAPA